MPEQENGPMLTADHTEVIAASGPFKELVARRSRLIVVALTAASAWFLLFIIGCSYWHGFMAVPIVEGLTIAYAWGLSQFIAVWVVTAIYLRSSARTFAPLQEQALAVVGTAGASEVQP